MNTEDIAKATASDWRPERNQQLLAVIGKLGEEASELAARCCRAVVQGLDGIDPDKQISNAELIAQEIADVMAMTLIAKDYLDLNIAAIERRRDLKVNFKRPWVEAIEPFAQQAPELLAAAKEALKALQGKSTSGAIVALEAAISKATGEET